MNFETQALADSTLRFAIDSGITFAAAYVGALLGILLLCITRAVLKWQ